jgi:excisionase family DNA binding protein
MARNRDDLLTTSPAARVLGVRPDTVRKLTRQGVLDACRTPTGQYVYWLRDVEQLARQRYRRESDKHELRSSSR